jgi:HTH-type transcriptional regulator/antitoxin HigA
LVEIERLRSAEPGGPDSDKLDVLATLVEKYEDEHWLIDPPDSIEAIKFRMEQSGYRQKDLAEIIGSASRAS